MLFRVVNSVVDGNNIHFVFIGIQYLFLPIWNVYKPYDVAVFCILCFVDNTSMQLLAYLPACALYKLLAVKLKGNL